MGANELSSSEDEDLERNPDDPMGIMGKGEDIEEIEVKASVHVNKSTIFKPEFTGNYANVDQSQNPINDTEGDVSVKVNEVSEVKNSYREELEGSPDPLNKVSFRQENKADEKVKQMFYAQKDEQKTDKIP